MHLNDCTTASVQTIASTTAQPHTDTHPAESHAPAVSHCLDSELFDDADSVDDLDDFFGGEEETANNNNKSDPHPNLDPAADLGVDSKSELSCGFRVLERQPQPVTVLARPASVLSDASAGSTAAAVLGGASSQDMDMDGTSGSSGGCDASTSPASVPQSWEKDVVRIVYMDWLHSVTHLAQEAEAGQNSINRNGSSLSLTSTPMQSTSSSQGQITSSPSEPAAGLESLSATPALDVPSVGGDAECSSMPPSLPASERFPVILGTDILYEMPHAAMVAAVISHRLEAGGKAMLGCAVRQHVSGL